MRHDHIHGLQEDILVSKIQKIVQSYNPLNMQFRQFHEKTTNIMTTAAIRTKEVVIFGKKIRNS